MKRRTLGVAALILALAGRSQDAAWAQTGAEADRPFVEHRLALQLSDAEPEKQGLVLSVAFNVLKAYGPDRVAIEVVAFGPGIVLLRQDNPRRPLIESLMAQNVVFDVCMNSVETAERATGTQYPLHPQARKVAMGVPHILSLTESGYTLVRP